MAHVAAVSRSSDKPRLQPAHRRLIVLRRREQMPVGIEGHLDRRVPHQRLHPLWRKALRDEHRCRGMAECMQTVFRLGALGDDAGRLLKRDKAAGMDAAKLSRAPPAGWEYQIRLTLRAGQPP